MAMACISAHMRYFEIPSKDPIIKTVWSCVIVDVNTKSEYLNKSVNITSDCDADIDSEGYNCETTKY